ncbi:MAG: hypothetical protein OEY89_06510, partial [Gammaproteobacteria bacterium]|nr:hypothetical protein [Gammaproteobacteria bacterium]
NCLLVGNPPGLFLGAFLFVLEKAGHDENPFRLICLEQIKTCSAWPEGWRAGRPEYKIAGSNF